jgi:uncharacterized protein
MISTFGERYQKVAIDAGFTCPNRDGSKGIGGCTYCNNNAFNPSYCNPTKPIPQQIEEGIEFHAFRYRRAKKFLAYFQPYSNTYDSVDMLHQKYMEALSHPLVYGVVLGTRPDCITPEIIELLQKVSAEYLVFVEIGMESVFDETLKRMNRGHTHNDSILALKLLSNANIHIGAHFIFGLPGESRLQMMQIPEIISSLPLNSVKFHQLQIIIDTPMAEEYSKNPENFHLFELDEYIEFIIDVLESLSPDIVVERLTGEVPPRFLVDKGWGLIRADKVMQMIEKRMEQRDSFQGKKYLGNKK